MLFNSYAFVVLLLSTLLVYYLDVAKKRQVPILIVSSAVFYGYEAPKLLILLGGSVLLNAIVSFQTCYANKSHFRQYRFWYLFAGITLNLVILGFFKYAGLIYNTLFGPNNAGSSMAYWLSSIPLPIGISFFTFQGISLIIDTYWERDRQTLHLPIPKNLLDHIKNVAFFLIFFPQLVSGPITKAHEFLPQIKTKVFRDIKWQYVFSNLVLGYFFKMVIADNLKDQTIFNMTNYAVWSSATLITLLFGYSMQIFADFAGYSLIALGLAALFGYELPINFNFPYISKSFSEFWTRWHMSLSSFLREYLYIPLGGNRTGSLRTYINLLIVMGLGGLWHGAAWSYAVWGLAHGLALVVERFIAGREKETPESQIISVLRMLFVFAYVSLAWLLFRFPEFSDAKNYLRSIFTNWHFAHNKTAVFNILCYSLPAIAYHAAYLFRRTNVLYESKLTPVYALILFFILTNSGAPGAFIYFQF